MDDLTIREEFYSKEDLIKLKTKLIYVAKDLVKKGAVKQYPAYPGQEKLSGYQYLVVNLEGVGEIRFYFTSMSETCVINGVPASKEVIEESSIIEAYQVLVDALDDETVRQTKKKISKIK